jgi:hypothetical protein
MYAALASENTYLAGLAWNTPRDWSYRPFHVEYLAKVFIKRYLHKQGFPSPRRCQ